VFHAHSHNSESLREATQLRLRPGGPSGIALDDADGHVEALVEGWVALEVAGR
jgi:hypothetical protein